MSKLAVEPLLSSLLYDKNAGNHEAVSDDAVAQGESGKSLPQAKVIHVTEREKKMADLFRQAG
jgi:hypothetical protein